MSEIEKNLFNVIEEGAGVTTVSTFSTIHGILIFVFNVAMGVGLGITLLNVAYGFIQYIASTGDKTSLQKAQNSVTWAIVGFAIILGSWAFKAIVLNLLGADLNEATDASY